MWKLIVQICHRELQPLRSKFLGWIKTRECICAALFHMCTCAQVPRHPFSLGKRNWWRSPRKLFFSLEITTGRPDGPLKCLWWDEQHKSLPPWGPADPKQEKEQGELDSAIPELCTFSLLAHCDFTPSDMSSYFTEADFSYISSC